MTDPNNTSERPTFYLYDYDPEWSLMGELNGLIDKGRLTQDIFLRLASVGQRVDTATRSTYLNWTMVQEIVEHIDYPDKMREETRAILFGDLPDAIVDVNSNANRAFYRALDTPYYRMGDLVRAIHSRRASWGQALPDVPQTYYGGHTKLRVPDEEWWRCRSIARPIWSLLVKRFHPEWLDRPDQFHRSSYIGGWGSSTVYYVGEKSQRREVVTDGVFSDPTVLSFYQEAIETRVHGLGKVGVEDLRIMLIDEHPELMVGHELPRSK